jgi:type IV secretory pathway VirB2 component (pilin)
MKKMLKYMAFALAIALVFTAGDALATNQSNVFTTVTDRMIRTFQNSRSVIFIVGGFGLIGLGFAAIFGKVNWKWLAALACGLAIVAVAGQVVDYVTRSGVSQGVSNVAGVSYGDTLTDGSTGYHQGSVYKLTP